MVVVLCRDQRIPLINIVRRQEQVDELKALGSEYILNSTDPDFEEQLTKLAKDLRATAALDAIAGQATGQLLRCMPYGSRCYVYGALAEKDICDIDPLLLIGRQQAVDCFLLNIYVESLSIFNAIGLVNKANKMMSSNEFKTKVYKRISLDGIHEAVEQYKDNMSRGKYLVYPNGPPAEETQQ